MVVAHRLSTIRNADMIVGMAGIGKIVEKGNHNQLIKADGVYTNLCRLQTVNRSDQDQTTDKSPDLRLESVESLSMSYASGHNIVFDDEKKEQSSYWKILKLNQPELCLNIIGCLSSFGVGAIQP